MRLKLVLWTAGVWWKIKKMIDGISEFARRLESQRNTESNGEPQ